MRATPLSFAERGPHPVGLQTLDLIDPEQPDRRLPTDLWYPAEPDSWQASEAATHPFQRLHAARGGAAPTPGRFPLIAFSHGNSGLRRQSTFLTTHLASWGMVVVAPDHTGNTFPEMALLTDPEQRRRVHFAARRRRPADLALAVAAALEGGRGRPSADPQRVAALGHSFGGWTSFKMPRRDARIRAVCGLAPASEPFVGRKAFEPDELPFRDGLPALIVAGIDDVLVDLDTSVRPLFGRLSPPCALIAIERADHFHFCDGVELLHAMHENNPRPDAPRPTRPMAELLPEERTHRLLRAVVTSFFQRSFSNGADPCAALGNGELAALDPALRRIERGTPK